MSRSSGHAEPWGEFVDGKLNVAELMAESLVYTALHKQVADLPADGSATRGYAAIDTSSAAPELYAASQAESAGSREFSFCQPCNSPIWDTSMSLSALCEAGYAASGGSATGTAMEWLFSRQITTPGDWSAHCPGLECGGWAFQYENVLYPDVDDTAKVLMSLFRAGALDRPEYREQLARAVRWVLGMQNSDGGWGRSMGIMTTSI